MTAISISMSPRQWFGIAVVAIIPGELLWFATIYPLVPRGGVGWAIAFGLGAVATVWAVCSIAALSWLSIRKKHWLVSNTLGVVVALQLGAGIFALAVFHQDLLAQYFSYVGRR